MAEFEAGKGLGLSLDLQIGSLNDAVTTLANALRDEVDKGGQSLDEWVNKVYDYASKIRESWGGEEGQEGGEVSEKARDAYHRAVGTLRNAATAGQQRAADALKNLGERLEPEEEAVGSAKGGGHKSSHGGSSKGKSHGHSRR